MARCSQTAHPPCARNSQTCSYRSQPSRHPPIPQQSPRPGWPRSIANARGCSLWYCRPEKNEATPTCTGIFTEGMPKCDRYPTARSTRQRDYFRLDAAFILLYGPPPISPAVACYIPAHICRFHVRALPALPRRRCGIRAPRCAPAKHWPGERETRHAKDRPRTRQHVSHCTSGPPIPFTQITKTRSSIRDNTRHP